MSSDASSAIQILPWTPSESLALSSEKDILFSRGFLRCTPEKWFPGIDAHWLPVSNTFDIDIKVKSITPTFSVPKIVGKHFSAHIGGESVAVIVDSKEVDSVLETFIPNSHRRAKTIALDYFTRRFLISLATSWSGREELRVDYKGSTEIVNDEYFGAVNIVLQMSNIDVSVWLFLAKKHVEILDGMWRRQTSSFRAVSESAELALQVAELAVPTNLLGEYTKPGAIIDLETPEKTEITILKDSVAWSIAEMTRYQDSIALLMKGQAQPKKAITENTTPVSIELGSFEADPAVIAEFGQVGSVITSPLILSNKVQMKVRGELVSNGELGIYNNRFTVTVD